MQSLGFESKNPTIFNMIADLESEGREVDFEEFLDAITAKLGDKESRVPHIPIPEWNQQNLRVVR